MTVRCHRADTPRDNEVARSHRLTAKTCPFPVSLARYDRCLVDPRHTMIVRLRWSTSDHHQVWRNVVGASLVALVTVLSGCGVSAETSSVDRVADEAEPSPAPSSGGTNDPTSCAPTVSGLTLTSLAPVKVQCPTGFNLRDSSKALPIAGRFTTDEELVNAYCVAKSTTTPSSPSLSPPKLSQPLAAIDFEANDVVAYAYDANAGSPSLYRRGSGEELWLRTVSDTCTAVNPTLASVAFVIPKRADVHEQTCSRSCR